MLPQIARGDANKMWIIPSELTEALKGIGGVLGRGQGGGPTAGDDDDGWVDPGRSSRRLRRRPCCEDPAQALAEAAGRPAAPAQEADGARAPAARAAAEPPSAGPVADPSAGARAPPPARARRPSRPTPPAARRGPRPRTARYAARIAQRAAYRSARTPGPPR